MSSLAGQRIVITRADAPSEPLRERLEALGATVVALPAIRVAIDAAALAEAIARLPEFDWLVVTSGNAVEALAQAGAQLPPGLRVAAVGPRTASRLAELGVSDVLVPERYDAEALADLLAPRVTGCRVLLPRGDLAREVLPKALRAAGASVEDVVTYRTVSAVQDVAAFEAALEAGGVDWVTFASGSAVRALSGAMARPELLRCARLASLGPKTSAALRELGVEPACEAEPSTLEGLVAALASYR
ncbi:MAG TPA: uroporphyrinogen-III synthase [Oscillatoriaceae cyanobacterium]